MSRGLVINPRPATPAAVERRQLYVVTLHRGVCVLSAEVCASSAGDAKRSAERMHPGYSASHAETHIEREARLMAEADSHRRLVSRWSSLITICLFIAALAVLAWGTVGLVRKDRQAKNDEATRLYADKLGRNPDHLPYPIYGAVFACPDNDFGGPL